MSSSTGEALIANLMRNLRAGLRLALLRPVSQYAFRALPGDCAALVAFNLIVWLAGDVWRAGFPGQLNTDALPLQLVQVPILLLLAMIVAAVYQRRDTILLLVVMWISTDWVFELASIVIRTFEDLVDLPGQPAKLVTLALIAWGLAVMIRVAWLVFGGAMPRIATAAAVVLAAYVGFFLMVPRAQLWQSVRPDSAEPAGVSIVDEQVFHMQPGLFADALDSLAPQRPGVPDLYFLGVAPYAREDVFLREMLAVRTILEDRFDIDRRAITLINNGGTLDSIPIATSTNLRAALSYFGELLDPEEDVLLMFLTSHGEKHHELAFSLPPLELNQLSAPGLARMLGESKLRWKILVVSACYSGGFIDALRDANTMVITASDATSSSFGCSHENDWTYFGRAFFDEALKKTFSFERAFEAAKELVGEWERRDGLKPSNPQMFIGSAIREVLPELEKRLERRKSGPKVEARVAPTVRTPVRSGTSTATRRSSS